MKNKNLALIFLFIITLAGFVSCSEESENQEPFVKSVVLSSDNKTATVTFSEAVYGNAEGTEAVTAADVALTITGVTFTYTVEHAIGSETMKINLAVTSVVQGTEVLNIKAATASSIYDADGAAMDAMVEFSTDKLGKDLGIIGKWQSSGANIAPLLVTYFKVDSISAEFKADKTYVVHQFNEGNTTNTPNLIFSGTYNIVKSTVGNIWTITITQTLPMEASVSGIFEIKKDNNTDVLWYEVVQTSGTQNVPPTPALGFGSSNGGTLGLINIQKYLRLP